ncbi:DUF6262 family protein [Bacillus cereus]|uniref:DUF6262 family protein n=1 Tax=Bacillus cereus TaxID=1396 RepID=UPI001CBBC24E|nr:DUF6262 family protein [Bacillus cereus]
MVNSSPNTTKMIETKKKESEIKKQAVLRVLRELSLLNDPINSPISKAEICRKACVSKTFLYSYQEELLKPINEEIKRQNQNMKIISQKQSFSANSNAKLIESLKRKITRLEEKNKILKNENAILIGKLAKES